MDKTEKRDYNRILFRSQVASLFWAIISAKKARPDGFKLQQLASELGRDKSIVSRWFSAEPNWQSNTIADIAEALDVDLHLTARDRETGIIFDAAGSHPLATTSTKGSVSLADKPASQSPTRERRNSFEMALEAA